MVFKDDEVHGISNEPMPLASVENTNTMGDKTLIFV